MTVSWSALPATIEFRAPLPSAFSTDAIAVVSESRETSAARSSPYRSAKIVPCDWPWSESTTMWYFRGATAATSSIWASTASMPASASSDSGCRMPAWCATAS